MSIFRRRNVQPYQAGYFGGPRDRRKPQRVPYVADNTTWTCLTCMEQAWVQDDDRGCGCGGEPGPRPLFADDPNHWSNRPTDARDELIASQRDLIDTLTETVAAQGRVIVTARHMLTVLAQHSATGPIFKLNDEHDEPSRALITHALLDLQAALNSDDTPPFCLPERTH